MAVKKILLQLVQAGPPRHCWSGQQIFVPLEQSVTLGTGQFNPMMRWGGLYKIVHSLSKYCPSSGIYPQFRCFLKKVTFNERTVTLTQIFFKYLNHVVVLPNHVAKIYVQKARRTPQKRHYLFEY